MAGTTRALPRRLVCEAGQTRQRLWPRIANRACENRAGPRVRPNGMGCARLERTGHQVLSHARRQTNARMDGVSINARWDRETSGRREAAVAVVAVLSGFSAGADIVRWEQRTLQN